MTSPPLIDTLQARPWPAALWRADQLAASSTPTCPSGFAALDAELPGGGWPQGSLTELLLAGPGQGEWRLLAPALARLSQGRAGAPGQELICIGGPTGWAAHGPGLAPLGLALPRLLWVDAPELADGAWAAEQALRAGSCAAVIWWAWPAPRHLPSVRHVPPRHRSASDPGAALATHLRRLHLAAQAGHSLLWVLRPLAAAGQSSPAALRLTCQIDPDAPGRLQLRLIKRRGPLLEGPLTLDCTAALGAVLAHRLGQPLPQSPRTPARTPSPTPSPASTRNPPHRPPLTPPHPPAISPTTALALDHARAVAVPAPAASAAGRARALA